MATNKIEMKYDLRQLNNENNNAHLLWFPRAVRHSTLNLRGLSAHIAGHGSIYTNDVVVGVLTKFKDCLVELVSQGTAVKLDGLGIFYPSIDNVKGGATEAQMKDSNFNPMSIIDGVHLRFTPNSSALDNLTSKNFLRRSVAPESQNIIETVKRTVNGKVKSIQTAITLEDFRTSNPSPASPGGESNGGGNSGGDYNEGD